MAIVPRGATSGAKTQNEEFFGTDLQPQVNTPYTGMFLVSFSAQTAVTFQYTLDSGSEWVNLVNDIDGTTTFLADAAYNGIPIFLRNGDTFNMRINSGGGGTLTFCRVDELF